MSAVVGERDKALRGTVPRNINPTAGVSLLLDADPPAFHQNSAGIPTISSAKFTATPVGFAGTVMWSITSGGKLTGTTPNERTLLFSDMTADIVKVTVTIIHQGEALIRVRTFFKVIDGAKGDDATDIDLSPEALVAALEGRITKSQLAIDLNTRIDLVDGPASNPQTVQGRVKKETDDRIAALTKEAQDRVTYVQQYTYSEQEIDSSLSMFATTITSQYKAYADAARDLAVSNATAYVQTYAYAKTTVDNSLTALANTLRSEFATNNGVSTAYLNQYYYTQAQTNSAIANATTTLSTTVGQHTTTLQSQAQSLDGLGGQLTWKIDNNGHVSGFGLASTPINGIPYSTMIFNVDVLAVALPGGAGKPIFTVGQVNGQSQAVFRSDLFVDGGIRASALSIGSFDNVVPDANMMDPVFWSRPEWQFIAYPNTFWRSTKVISVGVEGWSDRFTPMFKISPGATYLFEYQCYLSPGFQGNISVVAHLPGQAWFDMGGPSRGYSWPPEQGGLLMNYDGGSPQGVTMNQRSTRVNDLNQGAQPDGSNVAGQMQFRITSQCSAGYFQLGGFKVTRMSDNVLIANGAVTAEKIQVYNLNAISDIVTARAGGWGQGIDQNKNGIFIYDPSNMKRCQLGNLDAIS